MLVGRISNYIFLRAVIMVWLSGGERDRLIKVLEADLYYRNVRVIRQVCFLSDTKVLLREYGFWCRTGVNHGRVKSSIQIFVEMGTGCSSRSLAISDDQAMCVNSAIVELTRKDAESAHVLCLHYVSGKAEYVIAEMLRVDRRKVKALVSRGEGFVSGFLSAKLAA